MPPKNRALTEIVGGTTVSKATLSSNAGAVLNPSRAYGGKVAGATGAAALGGATVALDTNSGFNASDSQGQPAYGTPNSGDVESKFKASMQHLEAPINAAISEWLTNYSPNIAALLKMTGMEPTQLVDQVVKRFHRWGVQPSAANVHNAVLDVTDSAEERAAIRTEDQLLTGNIDEQNLVLTPNHELFRRTATAIAELRAAANCLPGGIADLIRIRAALQMKPEVFISAVQMGWGFHPEAILGDETQDNSETLLIR